MALLTPPTPGDLPMRNSMSFGMPSSGALLRPGDATFNQTLSQYYPSHEALALEKVVSLKARARQAPLEDFWALLSRGLADICNAQVAFVSQRLAQSEQPDKIKDVASCPDGTDPYLYALAWYYQDRQGHRHTRRNTRYFGWGCPCAAMKYGQVFLIPSRLQEHSPDNPNSVFRSLAVDAYMGVPLFYNGKCNAHFGLAWTAEGSKSRVLSWPFIESICHSLEDLILQRMLEGATIQATSDHDTSSQSGHEVTEPSKTFIPPVHILSHELRTPMQGVIGMLDLMHDIVQDAVDGQQNSRARDVFQSLKHDIETIQESSKRAVDAADHVVQAYEREMLSGPIKAVSTRETSPVPSEMATSPRHGSFPLQLVENSPRIPKRRLSATNSSPREGPPAKVPRIDTRLEERCASPKSFLPAETDAKPAEQVPVKSLLQTAIKEAFQSSGRPESIDSHAVHNGRHFEARFRQPDGSIHTKHVDYIIDISAPATVRVVPEDFTKVISCLLQNAIKFTGDAKISLYAKLESAGQMLVINVRDNGPGIDLDFQTQLFQPFQKGEKSIRRRTEGLGLGLVVARGVAEKLGGVLNLASAETEGPGHGCDFEFRMPLSPTDAQDSLSRRVSLSSLSASSARRGSLPGGPLALSTSPSNQSPLHARRQLSSPKVQGKLALEYPLKFLVAEDNHINRKLLVNMLIKLGYDPRTQIHEAYDGAEAVKVATNLHTARGNLPPSIRAAEPAALDIVLMDLWMPRMDGYEAAERILTLFGNDTTQGPPVVWAVTADATSHALEQVYKAGMKGSMKKPFHLRDLESLIKDSYERKSAWAKENAEKLKTATAGPPQY